MALEKMSFIETDWYVTQEGNFQARDFIFKDFCDYIMVIKTWADKDDSSDLIKTDVIHINSNNGSVLHKKVVDLDPPVIDALKRSNFPYLEN